MRQLRKFLNRIGFNIWEVRFSDQDSNPLKSFYMRHHALNIPRIGDYIDLDEKRDWIVINVHHNYKIKEILIFVDKDFNLYAPLISQDPRMVALMEQRDLAHLNRKE